MGYLKLSAIATVAMVALTACQGQNPLKQQSNPVPVKEYPHVATGKVEPYVPGKQQVNPAPPDNSQYVCYEPFKVSVSPDQGVNLMTFTEEVPGKYTITVRSFLDDNFEVKADLPKGASLNLVSGEGSGLRSYEFMWMPTKNSSSSHRVLNLTFVSPVTTQKCGVATTVKVGFNLAVNKSPLAPTVTFSNLPKQGLAFGDSVKFQIQINDPASTADSAPILNEIQYRAIARSAERSRLDASPAVDCESKGQFVSGTTWQFNCSYDSRLVKGVEAYLNKNADVDTTFFASAQSTRSSLSSAASEADVRVAFTQVQAPTVNTTATETESKAQSTSASTEKKAKSSKSKKGSKS